MRYDSRLKRLEKKADQLPDPKEEIFDRHFEEWAIEDLKALVHCYENDLPFPKRLEQKIKEIDAEIERAGL